MTTIAFAIWPGEQPTVAAMIGDLPILVDFDTGDSGTLYLQPTTQKALEKAGLLRPAAEGWSLAGLRFGGTDFAETPVTLVASGGPEDHRRTGRSDWLRLGSDVLSEHPALWNMPEGTITVLRRGTNWPARR